MEALQEHLDSRPSDALGRLTLELARELRRAGAPAHRVEDQMADFARSVGSPLLAHVLPGAVLCSDGDRTTVIDVRPGPPDLDRLSELAQLADEVADGEATLEEALLHLEGLGDDPRPYGTFATLVGFGVGSACAVPFFGGGAIEALAAGVVGVVVGMLIGALGQRPHATFLIEAAAAAAGIFLLHGLATRVPVAGEIALICGLIVLLPGFALTTALTELATQHRVSGTSGLAAGGLVLMQLGFGTAVGSRLGEEVFGPVHWAEAPVALPGWVLPFALVGVSLAFGALLQARTRHLPQLVAACGLALGTHYLATPSLGPELAGGAAAFAVTLAANAMSRELAQPAAVWQLPGILLLVPGSIGFRSITALLENDVITGVEGAFGTALAAMSLVGGSLLGSAVVAPRRAL